MIQRVTIKVFGRVQGVGFRYDARELALGLELTGFARNEEGGSLSIEVQGEEVAVAEFLTWCRKGPASARVERVDWKAIDPKEHSSGFVVQ